MRNEKPETWGPRVKGFLFTIGGLLLASSSLAAQPPQAQPALPPPYVPPAPANPAPPPYVAPTGGPVIPAPPPPSEGIGFPGQPAPTPPGPPNLAVVDPSPGPMLIPYIPRPRFDPNDPYRVWARTDLMVWWVKNAPLNAQVVAFPNGGTTNGTVISPGSLDYGTMAGFRFVMGGWFDSNNTIGMEVGFFTTEHVNRNYGYSSDGNGNPTMGYAYVSQWPGFPSSFMPISEAGVFSGNVIIAPSMQFWGAEVNGVLNLWRSAGMELTLLGGFRYANLQENVLLSALSQFSDGSVMINNDNFGTRNQFYGGQVGARFGWQSDRLSVDVTGKLAVGGTYQSVDIQGNTVTYGGGFGAPAITPGGFYAQQSNSGHFTGGAFSFMPAVELKISYALSSRTRLYLGYDFTYWSNVVRPGSQISSNINLSQSQSFGVGALTGPATPAPLFNRSDFWAQGLTFGVEFRF